MTTSGVPANLCRLCFFAVLGGLWIVVNVFYPPTTAGCFQLNFRSSCSPRVCCFADRCKQTSVDPDKARSGIGGLYSALITSFTASTYQPAGQLALGLHVGTLLKVVLVSRRYCVQQVFWLRLNFFGAI